MATTVFIFLLPLILATISTTSYAVTTTVSPPPPQQLQLNSIIDAIIGAGDFNNWANLLGQADPSIIPVTVTFFIPNDDAFLNSTTSSANNFADPLVLTYHIIPRRFSFSDLCHFPTGSRLPTLLPGNTLLITNNSAVNFTINDAFVTHPDLFQNAVVSVHGVSSVLDYTLFGNDHSISSITSSSSSSSPLSSLSPKPVQEQQEQQQQPSSISSQVNQVMWKSRANRNTSNIATSLNLHLIVCLPIICVLYFWDKLMGYDLVIENNVNSL